MEMSERLLQAAEGLAEELDRRKVQLVLAESCTAGLASAALATVPGIADYHCGSAVTYREETKIQWLGVDPAAIREHTAVSEIVARQMTAGVLERTPEAGAALSITGHLGPNAPAGFDGLAFIAVAGRGEPFEQIEVHRVELEASLRRPRQQEAAARLLETAARWLEAR